MEDKQELCQCCHVLLGQDLVIFCPLHLPACWLMHLYQHMLIHLLSRYPLSAHIVPSVAAFSVGQTTTLRMPAMVFDVSEPLLGFPIVLLSCRQRLCMSSGFSKLHEDRETWTGWANFSWRACSILGWTVHCVTAESFCSFFFPFFLKDRTTMKLIGR